MSFAKIYSAQVNFLSGIIVTVEVDLSKGLHSFSVVGLPDKAVDESKDRVSSAIKNSGFKSPKAKNQKITVSLSPADLRKEGPFFDLAIAICYLSASKLVGFEPEDKIFLGELGLDGALRPLRGVLPLAKEAGRMGFKEIFLPRENAMEAALIEGIKVFGADTLLDVVNHLNGINKITSENRKAPILRKRIENDFYEIKGQESAKRGLEIAAAGGHNIAMHGPPGTGKTMLAKAFAGILPDLSLEESLEVSGIHSIAGAMKGMIVFSPPFRSPHHTASYPSLIGGGSYPKPGEITLAHRGVLFMDEFPEFENRVLESLRQPLEENIISISRARGSITFPSNFILVAAMNPCPCGNAFSKELACSCRQVDLERYKRKISGPIMDRIDLWVSVGLVNYEKLGGSEAGEKSEAIRERVIRAREIQKKRFTDTTNTVDMTNSNRRIETNSEMGAKDLSKIIKLDKNVRDILNESAKRLSLSARAYHRVIKVARTVADLAGSEEIKIDHILEALQYRPKIIN